MSLTDRDISRWINRKNIVIHPYNESSLTGVGYDLRIGIIRPMNEFDNFYEDEKIIRIPPRCYCVVITEEFVWISKDLIGTLHSKGTLAAKGLFTNSTNVDPNFKGQMIMSVVNLSETEIIISKESPTFITLILHEVRTPTSTLVGKEGTKNSTRVLYDLQKNVYGDKVRFEKQLQQINELLSYMVEKNHEFGAPFEKKISVATSFFGPLKKEALQNTGKGISKWFKLSFSNIIRLISIGIVLYLLYDITRSIFFTKTYNKEDERILVLLIVAIVTLVDRLFKKKDD